MSITTVRPQNKHKNLAVFLLKKGSFLSIWYLQGAHCMLLWCVLITVQACIGYLSWHTDDTLREEQWRDSIRQVGVLPRRTLWQSNGGVVRMQKARRWWWKWKESRGGGTRWQTDRQGVSAGTGTWGSDTHREAELNGKSSDIPTSATNF